MKLSKTQEHALELIAKHGELSRFSGGYWNFKDCENPKVNYVGTLTIQSLIRKGIVKPSEYKNSHAGTFPVSVRLISA